LYVSLQSDLPVNLDLLSWVGGPKDRADARHGAVALADPGHGKIAR
jgi:hypothetical protein